MIELPRMLEPSVLAPHIDNPSLLIVDVCNDEQYLRGHIPGAVHVPIGAVKANTPPAPGKLANPLQLQAVLRQLGVDEDKTIVVYSDDGGASAGRFIWTLEMVGITRWAFLNGGLQAWHSENLALESGAVSGQPSNFEPKYSPASRMEKGDIEARLGDKNLVVWDARSVGEYNGSDVRAARGGHIPGAVQCEWSTLVDPQRATRLREDMADYLQSCGITGDKTIVTHCHTHQRSGLTWLAGKLLGFNDIRAYDGSWSEWGNDFDLPVEV